jgi:hypothetical protein
MMQEMFDWYMDNLFPEHRKQAIKHAEKDSRDRKKRLAQGPRKSDKPVLQEDIMDYFSPSVLASRSFGEHSGRSKWERIGSPLTASVVDWALIINPYTPPRMKLNAVSRQYDRYEDYTN